MMHTRFPFLSTTSMLLKRLQVSISSALEVLVKYMIRCKQGLSSHGLLLSADLPPLIPCRPPSLRAVSLPNTEVTFTIHSGTGFSNSSTNMDAWENCIGDVWHDVHLSCPTSQSEVIYHTQHFASTCVTKCTTCLLHLNGQSLCCVYRPMILSQPRG